MVVSKMIVVVLTDSSSPPLGSPLVLLDGPIVVLSGNVIVDEVGLSLVGSVLFVELPVDGFVVPGLAVVEFPVDGYPAVGVPLELELDKQLDVVEGGEVEMTAAPLKSHVAPVEAFC